jgi:thioredoxin 1
MAGTMLTVSTDQNFDNEVLESALLVFACFTAPWCRTCYPACLIADELAEKYDGKIKFVRVDAERSPEISARYHIRALPTIIIFQNAQPVKTLPGYQEPGSLKYLLDSLLAQEELENKRRELNVV